MAWLPEEASELGRTIAAGILGAAAAFGLFAKRYFSLKQDIRNDRSEELRNHEESAASKRWEAYVARQDLEIARLSAEAIRLDTLVEVLSHRVFEAQGETIKCEARMLELKQRLEALERAK